MSWTSFLRLSPLDIYTHLPMKLLEASRVMMNLPLRPLQLEVLISTPGVPSTLPLALDGSLAQVVHARLCRIEPAIAFISVYARLCHMKRLKTRSSSWMRFLLMLLFLMFSADGARGAKCLKSKTSPFAWWRLFMSSFFMIRFIRFLY